jgi:hypothetical protein
MPLHTTARFVLVLLTCAFLSLQHAHAISAGSNLYIDYNEQVEVPYSGFAGQYFLDAPLIHSPWYGPFFKNFQSPITDTLDPILLDAEQPNPQRVTESYYLPPILAPILTLPVAGWREEIFTDGWEWVLPGDQRFPWLFPEDQSLITRDGKPHPWTPASVLTVYEPEKLAVNFPPIHEGETLGIHKALLWVGTPGNRVWGDNKTDDGNYLNEAAIRVYEYPVPEPAGKIPGDLDGDGFVGHNDLNLILSNWNQPIPPANPIADAAGSSGQTPDGYVGIADLNTVLGNWNAGTPPSVGLSVPEPATITSILLLPIALHDRRLRLSAP